MTKKWKKYTKQQWQEKGHSNVEGEIVEFNPPLFVHGYIKHKDPNRISIIPSVTTTDPIGRFMKVEGGFGASFKSMGRMLIGKYYMSLKDVDAKKPIGHGQKKYDFGSNTKESYKYIWAKE